MKAMVLKAMVYRKVAYAKKKGVTVQEGHEANELNEDEDSVVASGDTKITSVKHRVEKAVWLKWAGNEDEVFVDVTFENEGEEGYFMVKLYNSKEDEVDSHSVILVGKGNEWTETVDTGGTVHNVENIGDFYTVRLFKENLEDKKYYEMGFPVKVSMDDGGWVAEDIGEDVIYVVEQGGLITSLYFMYEDGWSWSLDEMIWMNISEVVVSGGEHQGKRLATENVKIVADLKGKGFEDGLEVIRSGSVNVSEK